MKHLASIEGVIAASALGLISIGWFVFVPIGLHTGKAGIEALLAAIATLTAIVLHYRSKPRPHHGDDALWNDAVIAMPDDASRAAVETLDDPAQACALWSGSSIGLGRLPQRHSSGGVTPGAWPTIKKTPGNPGIRATPLGARVELVMPRTFANPDRYRNALDTLAHELGVDEVRIHRIYRGTITLDLVTNNPLAPTVALPWPPENPPNLDALRVGIRESGDPYRIRIRGTHMLLAGITGAGKSSAMWAILAGLAPAIKAGWVEVHMIDLKNGMEMAAGDKLYADFAYTTPMAIRLLEKIVHQVLMPRSNERRIYSMQTGIPSRKHIPAPGDPHHVVAIDEAVELLKLTGNTKMDVEIEGMDGEFQTVKMAIREYAVLLLLKLLTQARACGITLILATQNAAKEFMEALRDFIPELHGLKLAGIDQERIVFGAGARARGVRSTEIGVDEAGTVYVLKDTGGSAERARYYAVTDGVIPYIVNAYAPDRTDPHTREIAPAATQLALPAPTTKNEKDQAEAGNEKDADVTYLANYRRDNTATTSGLLVKAPTKPRKEDLGEQPCPAPGCTNTFTQTRGRGRTRKYCSDACKQAAHNARSDNKDQN
ncbi:FtsK/SpoIIIE domain-containing protein [Nocardia niigatensis]